MARFRPRKEYPTEDELERIRTWDVLTEPLAGYLDFVRSCWWRPDWGWRQTRWSLRLSTGGWSGNESIIGAMQRNFLIWSLTWLSSRVGGHYHFTFRGKGQRFWAKRSRKVKQ